MFQSHYRFRHSKLEYSSVAANGHTMARPMVLARNALALNKCHFTVCPRPLILQQTDLAASISLLISLFQDN